MSSIKNKFINLLIEKNKIKTTEAVINKINSENKYHLTTASALLNKSKNKYRKE